MKCKLILTTRALCFCSFMLLAAIAQAYDAKYAFKAGDNATYELSIRTELPSATKTTIGYLALRPETVDPVNGQTTMGYAWIVKEIQAQTDQNTQHFAGASIAPIFQPPPYTDGKKFMISPKGAVLEADTALQDVQLESFQGAAWQLPLQPLPPAGERSWTTHRQITIYTEQKTNNRPGPFGQRNVTRIESPADESITYMAAPLSGDQLTVKRNYDLASLEKVGDTPVFKVAGTGQYVFDMQSGRVTDVKWDLAEYINEKNVSMKVPITVTLRLLAPDEVAKLKSDTDNAQVIQQKAQLQAAGMPDGMVSSEVLGTSGGGGPFAMVSRTQQPVIGFHLQQSDFGGRKCFRTFEPIFDKPQGPAPNGDVNVVAKDGYAVGAITVNAGEFFTAVEITFMKKTATGLDPKVSYTSPWYNPKLASGVTKKLGGDGQFIYGICGRKGLNVDTLGIVTAKPIANVPGK